MRTIVPIDSNYHRRLPYGTLSKCPLPLTPDSGGWLLCVSKASPLRTTSEELSGSCSLGSGQIGVGSMAQTGWVLVTLLSEAGQGPGLGSR